MVDHFALRIYLIRLELGPIMCYLSAQNLLCVGFQFYSFAKTFGMWNESSTYTTWFGGHNQVIAATRQISLVPADELSGLIPDLSSDQRQLVHFSRHSL